MRQILADPGNDRVNRDSSQGGFGVVEVVIAIAVVAIILTSVAAGLAMSLKTSAELKFRGVALSKNQEVIEALRRERAVLGWDGFISLFGGGSPGTYIYCLNDETNLVHTTFNLPVGACADTVSWEGNDFIRELTVNSQTANQVTITSEVYWQGRDKNLDMEQILYKW